MSINATIAVPYDVMKDYLRGNPTNRVASMAQNYDNKVLMVVGFKKGVYNRWIFRFDDEFQAYDNRMIPDIKPESLNFVTLDTGLCVSMTEDETLELFPNTKGVNKSRVVSDPALSGEMRLYKKGGKVVFAKESKLYSLSLK